MRIATLIFHYQREDLTRSVLQQLRDQPRNNIIVVDDGSDIPFEEPGIEILRWPSNVGYLKSVNKAMQHPRLKAYKAAFMLNNDVKGLSFDMLNKLAVTLKSSPKLAAVSPAVTPTPHQSMKQSFGAPRYERHIDWVAPLVSIEAWKEVGGFDENLKGYGVDIQFCFAARERGWSFMVVPDLVIEHEMGGTVRSIPDAKGHDDLEFMNTYLCQKYKVSHWSELI